MTSSIKKLPVKPVNRSVYIFKPYSTAEEGITSVASPGEGYAVISIIFRNEAYSQIAFLKNGQNVTADSMITSGKQIQDDGRVDITIFVNRDDVITSSYYLEYGVKSAKVAFYWG